MSSFIDGYLPDRILGYGFTSSPKFSTAITAVASGAENRNRNWAHPLHTFSSPEGVRCVEDVIALRNMWYALGGPELSFAFRDPFDFASVDVQKVNVAPAVTKNDQVIGTGDGLTSEFQLIKTYSFGTATYSRKIYHPIVDSVVLALNGHDLDDEVLSGGPYTAEVDRDTGIVTITPAPHAGYTVSAGFLFDTEVRFQSDDALENMVKAFNTAGFAEINLQEVRPC